jgi:UDP:flavonoid glycosyltransferase YjiC (YdhE family)
MTPDRPGRFLIVTWAGGGNVPPALNLGTRLARDGNVVRVLGTRSIAPAAFAAGVPFAPFRSVPEIPTGVRLDDDWDLVDRLLNGDAVSQDLIDEAKTLRPDVLVADCMMGAALAAGERLGLPTAVLVHVLYRPFVEDWGKQVVGLEAPRKSLGLEPVGSVGELLDRTAAVLALTPSGLDEPVLSGRLPMNVVYVGPIQSADRPAAMPEEGSTDPLVLISLSTTEQGQRGALPSILHAFERLPNVRGLLTLGGVVHASGVKAPPNVQVRDFVPHEAVLPGAAAVVCHGGLSTITSALTFGVPLVCIPQGREQPLNAARVEACGAGRNVPADTPPPQLADAIRDVLTDSRYRESASRFAEVIRATGAGAQATGMVERLVRRPVHR